MRVVLDTNILLVSISSRSKYHWVYNSLINQKYELAVSNSILNEYEEKIGHHWHHEVATSVIQTLIELPNVVPVTIHFELNLITADPDDNKFSDCAFASNSHFLVTNDKDFAVLKELTFPIIQVLDIKQFEKALKDLK